MARAFEAPVTTVGKNKVAGEFRETEFTSIKAYLEAVRRAGNQIKKAFELDGAVRNLTQGHVYKIRPRGEKTWQHVVLASLPSAEPSPGKSDILNVRLSQREKERWTRAAKQDDRTLASWLRRILNQACQTCSACRNFDLAARTSNDPFPDEFWCSHYQKAVFNVELAKKCPAFEWMD